MAEWIMTETKQRILQALAHLEREGVSRRHILVSGSAVLFLADLPRERPLGDIDIFLPTRIWFDLYNRGKRNWKLWTTEPADDKRACDPPYLVQDFRGIDFNIFFQWRVRGIGDIDVNQWNYNSWVCAGYRCVPLELMLDWKQAVGRDKDLSDILLLREALGVTN